MFQMRDVNDNANKILFKKTNINTSTSKRSQSVAIAISPSVIQCTTSVVTNSQCNISATTMAASGEAAPASASPLTTTTTNMEKGIQRSFSEKFIEESRIPRVQKKVENVLPLKVDFEALFQKAISVVNYSNFTSIE